MEQSSKELIKNIPIGVEPWLSMREPNETIPLYEGEFKLVHEDLTVACEGRVYFKWFPTHQTVIEITYLPKVAKNIDPHFRPDLYISDINCGQIILNSITINKGIKITGVMNGISVLGDRTIPAEKVQFVVPNLKPFFGAIVRTKAGNQTWSARLTLKDDEYGVTLDRLMNYDLLREGLRREGGYMILYAGEIKPSKGTLLHSQVTELVSCLQMFFSFLNGRKTSPLFLRGVFEDEVLWTDSSSYFASPYKQVIGWTAWNSIDGIEDLWQNFRLLYKDEQKSGVLSMAIQWYLNANSNDDGLSANSIICAQVALELLYNWIVVEEKRVITGRDSENITASNKIRLLVNLVNADSQAQANLRALDSFVHENKDIEDRIDALVLIRNSVVHGQSRSSEKIFEDRWLGVA